MNARPRPLLAGVFLCLLQAMLRFALQAGKKSGKRKPRYLFNSGVSFVYLVPER